MPDDELDDEPLDNVDNDEPLEHDEPLKAHELHHEAELPKTATGKIQKYMLRRGRPAISAV